RRDLDVVCARRLDRRASGFRRRGDRLRTLLRRRLRRRRRCRARRRRAVRSARLGGYEHLPQLPGYGSFNSARRRLDELAHLLELGEYDLALDAELLRKLVYAGLACHCTPHSEAARAGTRGDLTRALEA